MSHGPHTIVAIVQFGSYYTKHEDRDEGLDGGLGTWGGESGDHTISN